MTTKLYHHKTDGGAEYLCTSPISGTDEGDLYTAIIRLDGEPELLTSSNKESVLPTVSNYGNYSNDNYGAHCLCVDLGDLHLYYSYKTIVAYYDIQDGMVCSVNYWGTTTGKHLNWIESDHKARIKSDKFDEMLKAAIARHIQ